MKPISNDPAVKAADEKFEAARAKHDAAWDAWELANKRGEDTEALWREKLAAQDELGKASDERADVRGSVGLRLFREDKTVHQAVKAAVDALAQAARACDAARDLEKSYQEAGVPVPQMVPIGLPTLRGGTLLQSITLLCERFGVPVPAYASEILMKLDEENKRLSDLLEKSQWSIERRPPQTGREGVPGGR